VSGLELRRADGAHPLVVGHRGAAALAGENSLAAIEAALALGVDMVELDLVRDPSGKLVVAHEPSVADAPTLDDALALIAASAAGLLLDLKTPHVEADAVVALRRHAMHERTLACSLSPAALRRLAAADADIARALSYPDDRLRVSQRPRLEPAVRAGLGVLRRTLPHRAPRWIRRHGVSALSLQWLLVTPDLVERCHAAGAAVLTWTIPDEETAKRLSSTGVDAMIADDPRFLMERPTL
jgi:glycerophosphoryl diester phosphodiesterase